jgi:hypothetical protein
MFTFQHVGHLVRRPRFGDHQLQDDIPQPRPGNPPPIPGTARRSVSPILRRVGPIRLTATITIDLPADRPRMPAQTTRNRRVRFTVADTNPDLLTLLKSQSVRPLLVFSKHDNTMLRNQPPRRLTAHPSSHPSLLERRAKRVRPERYPSLAPRCLRTSHTPPQVRTSRSPLEVTA